MLSVNSDTFTIAAVVLDGLSKWGLTDLNNVKRATKPKVMQATLEPAGASARMGKNSQEAIVDSDSGP